MKGPSPPSTPVPVTKPSAEVQETINALILGRIPKQHQAGVSAELRKILEEPKHRPYTELIARASHPCVVEYLPEVLVGLNQLDSRVKEELAQTKTQQERNDFILGTNEQKRAYYVGIAELLGRGFDVALKPNLIFDANNNPVSVRPKDQTRFPGCHKQLTGAGRRKTIKKKRSHKKTLRRSKMRRNMH